MGSLLKKITLALNALFRRGKEKELEKAEIPKSVSVERESRSKKKIVKKYPPIATTVKSKKLPQQDQSLKSLPKERSVEMKLEKTKEIQSYKLPERYDTQKTITSSREKDFADYETQFPDSADKKTSDIIIGFDLGTSTTKVVLRDPWASRAYAIPFFNTANPKSSNYLLPTRLAVNSNKSFYVPKLTEPYHVVNLKLNLIDDHKKAVYADDFAGVSISAFVATALYIACVLRYVRQWFFKNCKDVYMKNKINWHLNLGIPSKNYDELIIKELFEKCAMWGWWLSIQEGHINVQLANNVTENIHKSTFAAGIHPDHINVFPEVAAEVAGYARSPRRDNGLHLFIDIGASTLDVSTFVLHGEREQQYAFLLTEVKRLGAFELHLKRLQKISELLIHTPYLTQWQQRFSELEDATLPVPNTLQEYGSLLPASESERILKELSQFDEKLNNEISYVVCKIVSETKKRRDPLSSRWRDGLPVFICGGGSILKFYRDAITESEDRMKTIGCACFKAFDLPQPEGLQAKGLDPSNFHRIAVAYGLSYPFEDIGKIIPPSDVEDIEPQIKHKEVDYISKDMV